MYTHIIHLGDIHIRCGKEEHSRFNEYTGVFKELERHLKGLPCIQNGTAMVMVCGDIFHHKYKLEAYSILLWNTFIQMLTNMAPVGVICGNHDYRQEDPDTPDLIDVMFQSIANRQSVHPCHYLKETGTYVFENIEFGLVSIKDTLNAFNTQGIVESLPPFPKPSHPDCVSVALFHGTITQSALPNGQVMSAGKGYPLEWFKGYELLLLGDNHKQQVHQSPWGLRWGYPGSLVQQDIGEPVYGHGFLLWDLNEKTATPYHIYNAFGRLKLKWKDDTLFAKIQESFEPLETVKGSEWFPSRPHVTFVGSVANEWKVMEALKAASIAYSSLNCTNSTCIEPSNTHLPTVSHTLEHIHQLNNPTMWLEYIQTKEPTLGKTIQEAQWIETPNGMVMECVPMEISKELHELTAKYRPKLEELIQSYERTTEDIRKQRHRVVLKHLSWDWVYSYGPKNHFQFECLDHNIGLLNGKNASGKSAFIDTICIGLFGEPSLNRQLNQTKKVDEHCIHSKRPSNKHTDRMNVKIIMEVDNEKYELERHYKETGECSSMDLHLHRIDRVTNERHLIRSGVTLVNEWVKQHIGTLEDLLKTSIVCQMDNNNFFFAKPDEQKAMIDSAVNLKELQAYSHIVHEALIQYQNLLKTVTTILEVTDEPSLTTMTEEERMDKESQLRQLSQRCQHLEALKESCRAQMGSIRVSDAAPGETVNYWEALLATEPDWRESLDVARHQYSIVTYERSKHPSIDEDIESFENETEKDTKTIAQLEKKLAKRMANKPPSSRAKAFLCDELDTHRQWLERHREWMNEMERMEHPEEWIESLRDALERLEVVYTHWVKNEPEALLEPEDEGEGDDEGEGEGDGEADTDWESAVNNYAQLKSLYDKRNQTKTGYTKEAYETWLLSKNAFDEAVAECDTNDWSDERVLEENRARTSAYLEKRRLLAHTLDGLEAQMNEIKHIFDTHPDWKTRYNEWKAEQTSIESVCIESLETQKRLWESSEDERKRAQERLRAIQNDPWWVEWKQWKKKYDRCLKHQWTSVASVQKELDDYETEKQRVLDAQRMLAMKQTERECLVNGSPHPDCSVCQTRLVELDAQIHECKQTIGEWTIEKLEGFIEYYQKGLTAIQWVETFSDTMNAKYERYQREQDEIQENIDARIQIQDTIPIEDIRRQCQHYYEVRERARDADKYNWLLSLEAKYHPLEKEWKKLQTKMNKMLSEAELVQTECYWKRAVDVFARVSYQRPLMEREESTWNHEKQHWVEMESLPDVSRDTLIQAWRIARAAWVAAGQEIKQQKEKTLAELEQRVSFQSDWETHTNARTLIETELQWVEATEKWERSVTELQTRLLWKQERYWAGELERLEPFERAEQWLKWFEFQELHRELDTLQLKCQELREQLAIDDDHCQQLGTKRGAKGARSVGDVRTRRTQWKRYQHEWSLNIKMLTAMDTYLVGEKGKKKKEDVGDTFKEWVYQQHVLPMLEQYVNDFLASVGVELEFHIDYGRKALTYTVLDRGNKTSFAASSGFQQFIIGLGMRHALGSIGGTGNNLQHLFIDEGFTACDADNLEKAFDILQLLIQRGHYKSILLISHLEPIQEMVSLKIPLVRKGEFTTLTYGKPYPVFGSSLKRRGRPPKSSD